SFRTIALLLAFALFPWTVLPERLDLLLLFGREDLLEFLADLLLEFGDLLTLIVRQVEFDGNVWGQHLAEAEAGRALPVLRERTFFVLARRQLGRGGQPEGQRGGYQSQHRNRSFHFSLLLLLQVVSMYPCSPEGKMKKRTHGF